MKRILLQSLAAASALACLQAQSEPPPPPAPDRERPAPERGAGPERERPPVPMVKRTFLGVATGPLEPAMRAQLGLARGMGLAVHGVDPESPAAAVLREHDVLTKFDDQMLVNPDQLAVLVENRKPGDAVTLTMVRAGKEQTVSATLGEREIPERPGPFQPWSGLGRGPDFEHAEERMRDAMRRAEEQMHDWRRQWEQGPERRHEPVPGPSAPGRPEEGKGRRPNVVRHSTWVQDQLTIHLEENPEGRKLTITDAGKEVFRGPLNNDEERSKVPEAYREAVERLETQLQPAKPEPPQGEVL